MELTEGRGAAKRADKQGGRGRGAQMGSGEGWGEGGGNYEANEAHPRDRGGGGIAGGRADGAGAANVDGGQASTCPAQAFPKHDTVQNIALNEHACAT